MTEPRTLEEDIAERIEHGSLIAISLNEMTLWGCPHCGYRSGYTPVQGGGTAVWQCGHCKHGCAVLADGLARSTIGFGSTYPYLIAHPRRGIAAHGRPDKRPEGGGEFFVSRGVGSEWGLPCFVCGAEEDLMSNIAAYVQTKEAGERTVEMFDNKAKLDFRKHEPDYLQVKIGACKKHVPALESLHALTRKGSPEGGERVITAEIITEAKTAG